MAAVGRLDSSQMMAKDWVLIVDDHALLLFPSFTHVPYLDQHHRVDDVASRGVIQGNSHA
jgi:hypothetical protein